MTATTTRPKVPARVRCPYCPHHVDNPGSLPAHIAMAHKDVPMDAITPERSARNGSSTHVPAAPVETAAGAASLREIPIDLVDVGSNVRVDVAELEELAASIAEHGVLQPVKVTPIAGGRYRLVWGQRRTLAARQAGLATIPAIVVDEDLAEASPKRSVEQLVENLHRADLNPIDRARAMREVVDSGVSQADLARKLGIAPSTVANDLRLLETAPKVQELLAAGSLTPAHVKAIAGLGAEDQAELAEKAVSGGWSAHDTERQAKWAKDSEAQRQRNRETTARQTAAAIALLEKVANRKRSTISVASYSGRDVRAALEADGWKVSDEWLDAVKGPGACGCAGVWRLDVPYGDQKVELKPACNDEAHKAVRIAERDAEWERARQESSAKRTAEETAAAKRKEALTRFLAVRLGTPLGLRALIYAIQAGDFEEELLGRFVSEGDREGLMELDDPLWTVLEQVPDDELAQLAAAFVSDGLTGWGSGTGVLAALDAAIAEATS